MLEENTAVYLYNLGMGEFFQNIIWNSKASKSQILLYKNVLNEKKNK